MNYNDFPNTGSFSHQANTLPDLITDSAPKLDVPRREGQTNLLHSSDGNLVNQIVSNYSNPLSTDQQISRKDGSSQYYPSVGTSESSFYHKNHLQQPTQTAAAPIEQADRSTTSVEPIHDHYAHNPSLNQGMAANYPQSSGSYHATEMVASNSRNPALCKATPGRLIGTRPVQAVAPQPRNPINESKVVADERGARGEAREKFAVTGGGGEMPRDGHEKYVTAATTTLANHPPPATDQHQQNDPESLKIKLRKTKKAHKVRGEKHSSSKSGSDSYGVVSSVGTGDRIKLKISLKSSNSEESGASASDHHRSSGGGSDETRNSPKPRHHSSDHSSSKHPRSEKKRKKNKSSRKDSPHSSHHHLERSASQAATTPTTTQNNAASTSASSSSLIGAASSSAATPSNYHETPINKSQSFPTQQQQQSFGGATGEQQPPSGVVRKSSLQDNSAVALQPKSYQQQQSVDQQQYPATAAVVDSPQQAAISQSATYIPPAPAVVQQQKYQPKLEQQQPSQQQQMPFRNPVGSADNVASKKFRNDAFVTSYRNFRSPSWNDTPYLESVSQEGLQHQQQSYSTGPPPYSDSIGNQLTSSASRHSTSSMQQQQTVYGEQRSQVVGNNTGAAFNVDQQQFYGSKHSSNRAGHYMPNIQQQHSGGRQQLMSSSKQSDHQAPVMSASSSKQSYLHQQQQHEHQVTSNMQQAMYAPQLLQQQQSIRQQHFQQQQAMQGTEQLQAYPKHQSGSRSAQFMQQQTSMLHQKQNLQQTKPEPTAQQVYSPYQQHNTFTYPPPNYSDLVMSKSSSVKSMPQQMHQSGQQQQALLNQQQQQGYMVGSSGQQQLYGRQQSTGMMQQQGTSYGMQQQHQTAYAQNPQPNYNFAPSQKSSQVRTGGGMAPPSSTSKLPHQQLKSSSHMKKRDWNNSSSMMTGSVAETAYKNTSVLGDNRLPPELWSKSFRKDATSSSRQHQVANRHDNKYRNEPYADTTRASSSKPSSKSRNSYNAPAPAVPSSHNKKKGYLFAKSLRVVLRRIDEDMLSGVSIVGNDENVWQEYFQQGLQSVRVKFLQDSEEADIYKLKDLHYPDDSDVGSFDELQPGTKIVAKWPMNGKFYEATVINPLDSGGRRFRERRPPPKPFQADSSSFKKHDQSVSKVDSDDESTGGKQHRSSHDDSFQAYRSMADSIKRKKRDHKHRDERKAKKRRAASPDLIAVESDREDNDDQYRPPAPKKMSKADQMKKHERRSAVESRFQQLDGVGAYNRFMSILQKIFERIDSFDPKVLNEIMSCEHDDMPKRLISRTRLEELNEETIKLKNLGTLNQVPRKKLVKLMTYLVPIIRDGIPLKPMIPEGKSSDEQKFNRESKLERVYCATEAALVALNVMTSPAMSKIVYMDEVMERAAQLLRQQLNNTVYPEYDPVYKTPSTGKKKDMLQHSSSRMKRAHYKGTKNRRVLYLYNKLNTLLSCWVELIALQPLTDTTVLQVAPVGISPFFVENVKELQLSAIRLTTTLFSRYERHRKHIMDDIFESMARLPTSKRNLRSYRLTYAEETIESSDEDGDEPSTSAHRKKENLQYIQMVSALILQMIQAIIQLPKPIHKHTLTEEVSVTEVETANELKMVNSYDMARATAQKFLAAFLKKCSSKSEETDFRPLFENFLHDLLNTVNKPEWPASEMLLTVLGKLLVLTFSNKSSEMPLRVASLDYLGVVAAKLRRDALSSQSRGTAADARSVDLSSVKTLLARLEENANVDADQLPTQEAKDEVDGDDKKSSEQADASVSMETEDANKSFVSDTSPKKKKPASRTLKQRSQCLVLGYLRNNMPADQSLLFALNFYVGQWHRDVTTEYQKFQNKKEEESEAAENKALIKCQKRKSFLLRLSQAIVRSAMSQEERDDVHWSGGVQSVAAHQDKSDRLARALTNDEATQLTRFLASQRSFSQSFDVYLSYILKVCEESAVALRTRAMKCLAEVVAVDPAIMTRDDISQGVRMSLMDSSTNVREAAVDLIGRFVILKPDLVNQYYEMLTSRILDTGVSVRKRVIRILRDLCHEHPHLPQLTDACVKMIRRVNDEDGIKKLVHEVFMKMWFTPIDSNDRGELKKKALLITDIVAANRNRGYEWIEQLFKNLIDTPVENPKVELACRQIVDCLVQHVIIFENERDSSEESTSSKQDESGDQQAATKKEIGSTPSNSNAGMSQRNERLIATIQTLGYLAKIRPMYLVKHVMLLQPYLATRCDTNEDLLIVQGVCKILELSVPLMHRPSEAFLATLESEMMKLILTHRYRVVTSAVACLHAIVTSFTKNYKLIWDCFQRMCVGILNAKAIHKNNPASLFTPINLKQLSRALFIIGHLSKTFDVDSVEIKGDNNINVKENVYECLYYFSNLPTTLQNQHIKVCSLTSLGLLMIQDPDMMFKTTSRQLYKKYLAKEYECDALKCQVLQNLQNYLQTEDVKQQQAALANVRKHKQAAAGVNEEASTSISAVPNEEDDDIKEICDVSSGMSSSVMQLFLKEVLEAFFHPKVLIRKAALHTITLTLQQGLVHPNQCVPYLIAAASDPDQIVYKEADQQLSELSKKYSGFVLTNANAGIKMAYSLHRVVSGKQQVVRGFSQMSQTAGDEMSRYNKASCTHLYQVVRCDRKHRRSFINSLLRLFDETANTDVEKLIFVADNLAYFPYQTVDEPLFLMNAIEVFVSVSGSNVMQAFKEAQFKCKQLKSNEKAAADGFTSSSSEDESDDEGGSGELALLSDMDAESLEEFAHNSLACLLLLWLKNFLKSIYGFTDNKIHRYSPTERNRANDKQCHRRKNESKLMEVTLAAQYVVRLKNHVPFKSIEFRRAIQKQYYQLKELMNKLDPNEDDSSGDEKKTASANPTSSAAANSSAPDQSASSAQPPPANNPADLDSDRDTDGEMPKPKAPLDLIRQSTALKDRKKLRKSTQRVKYAEDSSSDDSDFQGF